MRWTSRGSNVVSAHHPATRDDGSDVSWREVAVANGKVAHPGMHWRSIAPDEPTESWDLPPQSNSLPPRLTRVLSEILAEFTGTPQCCWCAVWEGYGYMVGLRSDAAIPRLPLWNRPMIVGCGALDAVPARPFTDGVSNVIGPSHRSPGLWWPDDRSWCVATDIEFQETYLGASRACVDRLLSDDRLEAMRVAVDQSITWDSDLINATQP
jgi:hypothetical protein